MYLLLSYWQNSKLESKTRMSSYETVARIEYPVLKAPTHTPRSSVYRCIIVWYKTLRLVVSRLRTGVNDGFGISLNCRDEV